MNSPKISDNIDVLTTEGLSSYIKGDGLVLIDFYEPWCGPCQRFMKIYPNLAKEFEGKPVKFGKMNIEEHSIIKVQHAIHSIPTFMIFKNGEIVERWTGIKTLLDMKRLIESHLNV